MICCKGLEQSISECYKGFTCSWCGFSLISNTTAVHFDKFLEKGRKWKSRMENLFPTTPPGSQ